ncbi:MAG: adenylosuccinate synthetase, partial [Bacteriovoracaceae bacterium]|nr:adenylosuccinate synthetase [Bacteriovoracaceae bacterium]
IQELKVCYAYEYQGKKLDCAYPGLSLSDVKPLYLDMKPFQDDFSTAHFSKEFQTYLETIEKFVGIPVGILAFGPEREQILLRKKYFED